MRTQVLFRTLITTIAAVVIGSFGLVGSVYAAPGGGGGGGGKGGGGGGGGGDAAEPPDYGDLVILYRNEFGVPILDENFCQQPLAFPSDTCDIICTEGEPCLVPLLQEPNDDGLITCAIDPAFATCTHEIEFGRTNSARAPASVFESQLEDVVVKLATADEIGLDAAGRLVACVDGGVDEFGDDLPDTSSAVDSPIQNLAIYKQLMTYGYLGDQGQIVLPASVMETAARGIGVASDKGGKVSVDMVVYLNQIMGLSDLPETVLGQPICIYPVEEVMGVVQPVEKCFLNYGNMPIGGENGYRRGANFEALPYPPYIRGNESDADPTAGFFEVLQWTFSGETFDIFRGSIFDRVFNSSDFVDGTRNIGGFVQAADDTREVINYMHSWPLPVEYVDPDTGFVTSFLTPVTCGDSGGIGYDLSISADSGLQVPVQMVPTEEGREFIVTISNAGPDAASGSVWVKAETNGDTAVWKLLVDENGDLVYDEGTGLPILEEAAPFELAFEDLAAGSSKGWTTNFTVYPPVATKINWTATIVAEHDVNSTNNEVTETTNVRLTGKGGGKR